MGIKTLNKKFHKPIYAIYGFVRFADEIVDSFYGQNQKNLLQEFKKETYNSIRRKMSLNPILNSFQICVNKYKISEELIESFLYSMEMDLNKKKYDKSNYEKYIYGSAEVVGLMCLKIFCKKESEYKSLVRYAKSLGSAFQKINFLRDLKSDYKDRGRLYFPDVNYNSLDNKEKKIIEKNILSDFNSGLIGIKKLPDEAKFGVYLTYKYYLSLFNKISRLDAEIIKQKRIRVSNFSKFIIFIKSFLLIKLNLI